MGGEVTGVDAVDKNIGVASVHAVRSSTLPHSYAYSTHHGKLLNMTFSGLRFLYLRNMLAA